METDRELLELAAKAVGIDFRYIHNTAGGQCLWDGEKLVEWNPLTDDGDALRLAVKLMLFDGRSFMHFRLLETRNDPTRDNYKITRRAIVRAAAEIGKESK